MQSTEQRMGRGPFRSTRWGKRLGAAAFFFFLIKGIAWLVVPAAIAAYAAR
jgi:hypothetical protein